MPKPRPPAARKPRNPVARNPLLRKGGPHAKPATAKRQQTQQELAREVAELRRGGGKKAGKKRGRR